MKKRSKEIDVVVWDLETTGFVAPEARILEIGAYIIRGEEVEKKHWVINEGIEIPEKIVEITGITRQIVEAEGEDAIKVLNEFLPLLEKAKKNVTHNGVRFDIPFLTNYAKDVLKLEDFAMRQFQDLLRKTAFDTAVHFKAKKIRERQKDGESFIAFADRVMEVRAYGVKYNLALCCQEAGIDISNITLHRALGDVHLTYLLHKGIESKTEEEVEEEVQEEEKQTCTCLKCCNERAGMTGIEYSRAVLEEHENIKKGLPF